MAFDFAGLFFAPLLRRRESGSVQAISDADVYVYLEDGETAATLYTGRDKETEADNPTAPTSNGNLEFFADPGIYTVEVLIDGVSAFTDLVVVPLDPDNARGEAGTITVGTVEASAPGGDPAVENVGTASEAELNFTFPRGATGDTGATGPAWDGWQGAWVDGDYDANDVVSHEGESWIAPDGASTGDEPGVDAAWEKLAAKGADGEGSVSTVNGDSGPDVVLDHTDVGADQAGTAAAAVSSHEGAGDPHPGYLTEAEGDAAYEALVDRTGASEGDVPTLQGDGTLAFESGSSLPSGGSTGQVLAKASATDEDVAWADGYRLLGTTDAFAQTASGDDYPSGGSVFSVTATNWPVLYTSGLVINHKFSTTRFMQEAVTFDGVVRYWRTWHTTNLWSDWREVSAVGGTEVIAAVALSGAGVSFASIPSGYAYFKVVVTGAYASSVNTLYLRFNGDSGASSYRVGSNAVSYAVQVSCRGSSTNLLDVEYAVFGGASSRRIAGVAVAGQVDMGSANLTYAATTTGAAGYLITAAALSSIDLDLAGGTFGGGTAVLYGIKES